MRALFLLSLVSSVALTQSYDIDEKEFEKEIDSESRYISLKDAIEAGLRKNSQQKVRNFNFEINQLNKKDNFANFWLPDINLTLNTDDHVIGTIYESRNNNASSKNISGSFGIEVADYTIFNWGRDYLNYINKKATFTRNDQKFKEERRDLRFRIIANYFELSKTKTLLNLSKKRLRHSSFVYRLAKEKLSLRKIRKSEYLHAKGDFLKAHNQYHEYKKVLTSSEESFAALIFDNIDTTYSPINYLRYVPLVLKSEQTLQFALKKSPIILDAKVNYLNSKRSYQKALKENLPLPKISMRFAAYNHNFSRYGSEDIYQNDDGNTNLELVASINMSWKILGDGGFFNQRITKKSYLEKRISEIQYKESKRFVSVDVKKTHERIEVLQNQLKALNLGKRNALKAFNTNLDDYIAGKTPYDTFKDVLNEYITVNINYENAKYSHLLEKLDLAFAMGKDDLPGQNFENLGTKQ